MHATHNEPTKHVINMVEFAELILREARDRGLSVTRRRYKRRSKGKRKVTVAKAPLPTTKLRKRAKKRNPLSEVEG